MKLEHASETHLKIFWKYLSEPSVEIKSHRVVRQHLRASHNAHACCEAGEEQEDQRLRTVISNELLNCHNLIYFNLSGASCNG